MRLLHVVPTYLPATRYGGPIYSVHGLCKALASQGHDVHVFTTNVDGPGDSDVPLAKPVDVDGVHVWYFPSRYLRRLYWSPPMARALRKAISTFDLLHLHSIYLWPTWIAARMARRYKVPYILAPRGMLVKDLINRKSRWLKTAWITLIERHNLEQAAVLHLTSEREAQDCRSFGFRLPPMFVVPNGVELVKEPDLLAEPNTVVREIIKHQPLLLFLSRINWKKGLDRLLEAMVYIPHGYLAIAGNDEENYTPTLRDLARELGVMDRVSFIGPVQGVDKEYLFRNASLLVLPSYSENFGNVVLEAMARGCPAVVTPEVGVADIVTLSGGGQVVTGAPRHLGESIATLLNEPAELLIKGEAGRKHVVENYSWDAIAQKMISVYQTRATC
ncbi:MAG: glycosyltransferase [Gammaproteobacteria bacterium]|nr:glycosyltransferase [Gammaproteobacteria bacterium]MCP5424704.1 glycosyltransferase [Gammaproteobacteria bacterium]